jgi:hypothetical protein
MLARTSNVLIAVASSFALLAGGTAAAAATALVGAVQANADAPFAGFKKGQHEIRAEVGGGFIVIGGLSGNQLAGGAEYGYGLTEELSLRAGAFVGNADVHSGALAYVGLKYRFLHLHPRLYPFLSSGFGHQWGFPTGPDRRTVTGLGVRAGTGMDVAVSRRFLIGLTGTFDFGPRILPAVGNLATFRLSAGFAYLF